MDFDLDLPEPTMPAQTKEARILSDLTLGQETPLSVLTETDQPRAPMSLLFLPELGRSLRAKPHELHITEKVLKSIDDNKVTNATVQALKHVGYIDKNENLTEKFWLTLERQAPIYKGKLGFKHVKILQTIAADPENWRVKVMNECGLVAYRHALGACQGGLFSVDGKLSDRAKEFLARSDDERLMWLSKNFSPQHISILSLLSSYDLETTKLRYEKSGRHKTPWSRQAERIAWMQREGLLDESHRPTDLALRLRTLKTPILTKDKVTTRDAAIEKYLASGKSNAALLEAGLNGVPLEEIESRIFRLRVSGFLDDNFKPTPEFSALCEKLRIDAVQDKRPIWVRESRLPRVHDLTEPQRNVLRILAIEAPSLSEGQLNKVTGISIEELQQLTQGGILKCKKILIDTDAHNCFAIERKTESLLAELGVEKSLRGRFQKDSHARHDLMLWEALQDFKARATAKGKTLKEIVHEHAIYQAKISPNDNKGIATPDLVVTTADGEETAIEYGNYSPKVMTRKIASFPQKNIAIYSDSTRHLEHCRAAFALSEAVKLKTVTWIHLPGVHL